MTNPSGQIGKGRGFCALTAWAKSVTSRVSGSNELRSMNRAEFVQMAQDLNLSPSELYEILTGRRISADALDDCLAAEVEASFQLASRLRAIQRQRRAAARMTFPVAPCC